MSKINVLVIPSDNQGGVGFYRSVQPHIQLEKQYPEDFSVTFDMNPNFYDLTGFNKYHIIHIHKGIFPDMEQFKKALQYFKEHNIVTIVDIDDHWKLSPHHPQYYSQVHHKTDVLIRESLKNFDYVTTTTPLFESVIKKVNPHTHLFPNAIDPTDVRFKIEKKKSDKIRVGLIMGSSHEYDVMLLGNISNAMKNYGDLDKIQFVLCGFDTRGQITLIDSNGQSKTRPLQPLETVWYRYEKQITDDYKIVSPEYKQFLHQFIWASQYPNADNEAYKRCWTKDMNHYYEHYGEIDILLAPLEENEFNKVKSPLKVAECCFSHTAIIAQDFGPYTLDLINAIERGGTINPKGNALLVDSSKNHKQWAAYLHKLVNNPELLKQLQDNIYDSTHVKFDLHTVTDDRAKWYKEIVKK